MIYFPGNYGTKGSRSAFDRLIGEYLANGRRLPSASTTDDITVAEVIAAYWKHCEGYYSSSETDVIKMAHTATQSPVWLNTRRCIRAVGAESDPIGNGGSGLEPRSYQQANRSHSPDVQVGSRK